MAGSLCGVFGVCVDLCHRGTCGVTSFVEMVDGHELEACSLPAPCV